jgi:NADH:ubiquinone oxidoreductase subunit C
MLDNIILIEKDHIPLESSLLKALGYRFAAMTCEKDGEEYELIYHFDKDYSLRNLKVIVTGSEPIPSISGIYPSAFLIENEYQDLFGFTYEGLTIDYKGNLYLTPDGPKTPMAEKTEK